MGSPSIMEQAERPCIPTGMPAWIMLLSAAFGVLTGLASPAARAQQATVTLFQNVRIFDGKNATLSASSNVLVRGNKIESISAQPVAVDRGADTRIIDGGGRVLMPGLIDNHWHAMLARTTPAEAFGDAGFNNLVAGEEATDTLMRGFTTIRDVGGPVFGLKRAIEHRQGPAYLSFRRHDHCHQRTRGFPPVD